jgi:hypothetical protein
VFRRGLIKGPGQRPGQVNGRARSTAGPGQRPGQVNGRARSTAVSFCPSGRPSRGGMRPAPAPRLSGKHNRPLRGCPQRNPFPDGPGAIRSRLNAPSRRFPAARPGKRFCLGGSDASSRSRSRSRSTANTAPSQKPKQNWGSGQYVNRFCGYNPVGVWTGSKPGWRCRVASAAFRG